MKTNYIAGVDEAGRGPLAGPVIAATVILNPKKRIAGLKDSKQLSPKQRDYLYHKITETALDFATGRAEVAEIDEINILQATLLAMQRAVAKLTVLPGEVLVDGNQCPKIPHRVKTIINGDNLIQQISAASIIAKVTRDLEMLQLEEQYPGYGFAQHKGYATELHLMQLQKLGACAIHRKSFAPVREILNSKGNRSEVVR